MSTRCNIKVIDGIDTLWFYRHSDGYPEGAMPTLEKFLALIDQRRIRNNLSQACGWLILLGAEEYVQSLDKLRKSKPDAMFDWKVGSIEPTTEQHGDIEYLYTVDLQSKTIMTEKI